MRRTSRRGVAELVLDSVPRHIAQNLLMAAGPVRRAALRRHRTGMVRDPGRVCATLRDLCLLLCDAGLSFKDVRLLELGPGQTPDLLFCALLLGAHSSLGLDVNPYLSERVRCVGPYEEVTRELLNMAVQKKHPFPYPINTERFQGVDAIPADVLDVRQYDGRTFPLADCSRDVIWSRSVLEHVKDPVGVVREMSRVLVPGGVMCHIIDLRDHTTLSTGSDWLRFLRYPRGVWDMMTSNRSTWSNRVRCSHWERIFKAAGFDTVVIRRERHAFHPAFGRARLSREFSSCTGEDLSTAWVRCALRKSIHASE